MAHYKVAKRYAKGFMDYLAQANQLEAAHKEITQLASVIQEQRDVQNFLKTPLLDPKKKAALAKKMFASFSPETLTFIQLVFTHGRGEALGAICEQFLSLYRAQKGIQTAVITSPVALSANQINAILAKAKNDLPKDVTIEVENKIDENLIGGFILRVGDKQFDASLQTQLLKLKQEFDITHYIPKF